MKTFIKMTPKEKAKDLVRRFYQATGDFDIAKQCAGIAVFEIIDEKTDYEEDSAYWQEVRFEVYALGIL
jgi:hypothetical protein